MVGKIDGRRGAGFRPAQVRWVGFLMVTTALTAFCGSAALARDSRPASGAQLAQAEARHSFNIPAQPLPAALAAFGQQSGLQVSYPSGVATGLHSQPLSGSHTAEEALRLMLAGTGVAWRFTGPGTVVLERAAAGATSATALDAVMVSGERVERSIMETAASVSVTDAKAIAERPGVTTSNDVLARIPNVVTSETSNLAPAIRGVDGSGPIAGAGAFFAGTRPRMTVQMDGRPLSFNEVVFGDLSLWDVERVEMYRGAQSTLQGRNSIAGTMAVKTKDPTYEYELGGRIVAGNHRNLKFSSVVSGPIIEDQLAVRLSFDRQASRSYMKGLEPYGDVKNPGDFETLNLRGKVLVQPEALEGFSTLLTLNYMKHTGPQVEAVKRPFKDKVTNTPDMPVFVPRTLSGIAETSWEVNENFTFENTLAWTDVLVKRKAAPGWGIAEIDGRDLLAEPRLRFNGFDGRLKGVAGVYAFDTKQDEWIDFPVVNTYDDKTRTWAVFGEATVSVLDDLDLILGGRYEQERRQRYGGQLGFDIDFDKTYKVFLPKFGVAWHATDSLTVGTTVSRGYNGGGAGIDLYNDTGPIKYSYKPEYVWTYEAFARAELLDRRLQLTGNVFYSDYKDFQLPLKTPSPNPFSQVIRNADRVVTYGAEIGARWLPIPELELFGNIGLLKTEIKKFAGSSIEGKDLPRAPAFTADVGGVYRHASGFDVSLDARFSDAYHSDASYVSRAKVDPYFVANAQLGYTYGSARVFAYVQNIFDSGKPVLIDALTARSEDSAYLLRPRTFGVGLEVSF